MTRLSWQEIKIRAHRFAEDFKDSHYERGETQTFYNEFFEVFGVKRRSVATFEESVKTLGDKRGFIDLFWKGVLLVEQKSAGRSLTKAKTQALEYFPALKSYELPRYVLTCDFQQFELYDLDEGTETKFPLAELPNHVQEFGFMIGVQKRTFRDQDPVNIAAAEIMGRLHDALKEGNYRGHELERLLVRLLFCLFADDTGIFEPRGIFEELIRERTQENGSDLGRWLNDLFDVLNEPETARQVNLDGDLKEFPYINGDLFAERLRSAAFTETMRARLLEACAFSWDAISPAIFGALFQTVMNDRERRAQGAHYTTERNILKVIEPLFLDELRAEFARLRERKDNGRRAALITFHDKIAGLRFFDPACGCGNFLIIAYRELREIELALLKELNPGGQQLAEVEFQSRCNVNQFYGIELSEFPGRIAEVALWMTDHIANNKLSLTFGQVFARIPLKASPHIVQADALEMDWESLLPAEQCAYVFGNPPFIGAKYQTEGQRAQVRRIAALGGSGGSLDYVAAWFLKASEYANRGGAKIGFVATNSVTQGEQVGQLWPLLFDRYGMEIAFGHRTFAWGSDARGVAHVHVVIVGLTRQQEEPDAKRLFTYPDINGEPVASSHRKLTPYLTDATRLANSHLSVTDSSQPLNGLPRMVQGVQTTDFGHLIFEPDQRDAFLNIEPNAAKFIRPFLGADELINGKIRYILVLKDANPAEIRALPHVVERLERVKQSRLKSKKAATRALAAIPTRFDNGAMPDCSYLAVPKVSSERREYIPIAYLEPPIIPSNLMRIIPNAEKWHFALLTSRIHNSWMRYVGGRMKSDYQYTIGIVYNTFPLPPLDAKSKAALSARADAILNARALYPASTLADLYDSLTMPPELRKAHTALDKEVDRLYREKPFADDQERVEHLLAEYEKLTAPLLVAAQEVKTRRRKKE